MVILFYFSFSRNVSITIIAYTNSVQQYTRFGSLEDYLYKVMTSNVMHTFQRCHDSVYLVVRFKLLQFNAELESKMMDPVALLF